jgi:hypothetical protein
MKPKQVFALLILCSLVSMISVPAETEPVQVLIVGTYHFGNPGLDLHNVKTDDVRTPAKQAELVDLVARLARFNPNSPAPISTAIGICETRRSLQSSPRSRSRVIAS